MRRLLLLLLSLVSLLLVVACGGDGADEAEAAGGHGHGHEAQSAVPDGARTIEVTGTSFAFDPEEIEVEAGEPIAIRLRSEDAEHDFTIDELDAHVGAAKGEEATGGFTADEAGTYTYYCSVSGHREAGMEGTLVVR